MDPRQGTSQSAAVGRNDVSNAESLARRPLVSVCVPVYNNSKTIARCLASIVDQEGDFEILIVDDCSTDDSTTIAEAFLRPGDRLVRNSRNLGQAQNHQRCLEIAHGDLIQFVHCDDYLMPGALQRLATLFDNRSVGMAFAPRRVITDDVKWLKAGAVPHSNFRNLTKYNDGVSLVSQMARVGFAFNWIGEPTSVMFRRRLALEAGGFHTDCLDEVELWLRLLLRCSAGFIPEQLSVRNHKTITEETWKAAPWWLDQMRILTWMTVDPASPLRIRVLSALWWPVAWLGRVAYFGINGPERWSRLAVLALEPFREASRAWRLRGDLNALHQISSR